MTTTFDGSLHRRAPLQFPGDGVGPPATHNCGTAAAPDSAICSLTDGGSRRMPYARSFRNADLRSTPDVRSERRSTAWTPGGGTLPGVGRGSDSRLLRD